MGSIRIIMGMWSLCDHIFLLFCFSDSVHTRTFFIGWVLVDFVHTFYSTVALLGLEIWVDIDLASTFRFFDLYKDSRGEHFLWYGITDCIASTRISYMLSIFVAVSVELSVPRLSHSVRMDRIEHLFLRGWILVLSISRGPTRDETPSPVSA